LNKHEEFTSAGGGFGPVSSDGYGISYIISGENKIFFHISSRKSSNKTVSQKKFFYLVISFKIITLKNNLIKSRTLTVLEYKLEKLWAT